MKKIAVVTSHPIQYHSPWFRLLSQSKTISPKIFYTWEQSQFGPKYDPGFGKFIEWDIPLLEGYDFLFVKNVSTDPGTHHFKGIINPTLVNEIKKWKPDVLLVIGWNFQSHLKCLRYFHNKIPILFKGDSTLLDKKSGLKKIIRLLFLKWVYRHIDYALYVGTNNKLYFLKHGLNESHLIFAPHAIDNDRFRDSFGEYQNKTQAWKKELSINEQDVVLLFAGKLENKKNPFLFVEIAKKIKNSKLKFVFVGNGVLEKDIRQAVNRDERFIFLGFQNQMVMPVVYRLCDIFVLPSKGPNETWGLGVNEAMASGKAVAITDKVGCGADLVKAGINGIIFPSGSESELTHLIEQVLKDKNIAITMGEESKKLINNFSYSHIIKAIESIVHKL